MNKSVQHMYSGVLSTFAAIISVVGLGLQPLSATGGGATDTDGDGLADAWEQLHFGNLSQAGGDDPDGDGYNNEEEESYGLDPNVSGGLPGYLSHEGWYGIGGNLVDDLINHTKFHQRPDVRELVPGAESSLYADNYGSRLRGTVTAPVTGSYTFWVAGDNGVEMWLSSDGSKFNRQRIAWHEGATGVGEWDKYATQKSAPIRLVAGRKYYVEALHKEGTGADHIALAWSYEADDLINLARAPGTVATQSSTRAAGGEASRAIDGNRDGNFAANSVTHTNDETNSWWQVDLGADHAIEGVVLHNRTDFGKERLSNFRVSVLDGAGIELYGRNYHTESGYVDGSLVMDLETPVTGRIVRVSILGRNLYPNGSGILSLAEVEVVGSASGAVNATPLGYLTNWTQHPGVLAEQSTTRPLGGAASRAIDGNRDGNFAANSVTHTNNQPYDWWKVDLGTVRPVSRIAIYNRTDTGMKRLSNFRITLLDGAGAEVVHEDFYVVSGWSGYRFRWDVPVGTTARTVRIERLGPNREGNHILSFAEVEVLGSQSLMVGAVRGREPIPTGALESYVLDPNDTDDDGLPNDWEVRYGFDPESADDVSGGSFGDPDGDFIANWQEYQHGTDPTVPDTLNGALLHELWSGVPNNDVETLWKSEVFLRAPAVRGLAYTTEGPTSWGDNYGNRLRGYITAPTSGNYTFWLSGDNETQLWLSTDENRFNRQKLIAPTLWTSRREWDVDISQKSRPVTLEAGRRYYIEIWHKESFGGDHFAAAWQPPGGVRDLIPGEYLTTFVPQAVDKDDDGLPDSWEVAHGLDPADNGSLDPANGAWGDADGDGLANVEELAYGTRPDLADTDGDGVGDYDEVTLLGTQALVGDVAPFEVVQAIVGSACGESFGKWGKAAGAAYTLESRGWIEYAVNAPAAGVYLLDLEVGAWVGGDLGETYEAVFSVDGSLLERTVTEIPAGQRGNLKTLTPWLKAGAHTVRVFVDNTLTARQVALHGLTLLASHGQDLDGNTIPDWVDMRITRNNGIDSPMTTSKVSPVCLEGRSRYLGLVTVAGNTPVNLQPSPGDRWHANVDLDPLGSMTTVHLHFENDALVNNHHVKWIVTNLLEESAMSLRVGDSLRLSAFIDAGDDSGGRGSENVELTVEGRTFSFKANQPQSYRFDTAGVHVIGVTHTYHGTQTRRQVTVTVSAPSAIGSPVFVAGCPREWDLPALPAGAVVEIDDRVEVVETIDLGAGATRYIARSSAPETFYAQVRLGENGAILQSIPLRGLTMHDANDTGLVVTRNFGDGSYQVDMPLIVSTVYDDIRVHYNIFLAGVVFDTGGIDKDYFPADFDALGRALVSFIKTGTDGSACHRTSVWQGSKRIALFY